MAIGSQGEIGTEFDQGPLHDWMNGGSRRWRDSVGDQLLGGYAQLDHPRNHPGLMKRMEDEALQMFPMRAYSESSYNEVRANVLAWWHARGIILTEEDGGGN